MAQQITREEAHARAVAAEFESLAMEAIREVAHAKAERALVRAQLDHALDQLARQGAELEELRKFSRAVTGEAL